MRVGLLVALLLPLVYARSDPNARWSEDDDQKPNGGQSADDRRTPPPLQSQQHFPPFPSSPPRGREFNFDNAPLVRSDEFQWGSFDTPAPAKGRVQPTGGYDRLGQQGDDRVAWKPTGGYDRLGQQGDDRVTWKPTGGSDRLGQQGDDRVAWKPTDSNPYVQTQSTPETTRKPSGSGEGHKKPESNWCDPWWRKISHHCWR